MSSIRWEVSTACNQEKLTLLLKNGNSYQMLKKVFVQIKL